MATAGAAYTFSSQPKAVSASRKKYREPAEVDTQVYRDLKETCITWDKRVHRGNTYSIHNHSTPRDSQQGSTAAEVSRKRRKRTQKESSPFDIPLPQPERIPVDLSKHLVAKEEVKEVAVVEAQTDEFLPEPPPEQYQPQKTGVDISTQVEDGEIFNFDLEAEPILDVLVSKTIEQSIMEVEEEFEMDRMKEFKESWSKRQDKMMEDWNKQVDEEWVRWHKKEEVLKQKRAEKQREAKVLLKIQAVAAAKSHLANIVPNAVRDLHQKAFPDEKALAIDQLFLPELFGRVRQEVLAIKEQRQHLEDVVSSCVLGALAKQSSSVEVLNQLTQERNRRLFEDHQIRRGKLRILMDDGRGSKVLVGPITISSKDLVPEIEERIYAWLEDNEADVAGSCPWGVRICIDGQPIEAALQIFAAKSGQISMVAKPEPPPPPQEEGDGEPVDDPDAAADGDGG